MPPLPRSAPYAALLAIALALAGCERVHPAFITDDQGRALVLHGLNVSSSAKGPTWHYGAPTAPDTGLPWITEADAHRISADWGFNVARYLIFWQHIEPQPGVYDDAYLDAVAERVRWLGDAGIHVILDMHQDVYGKRDTDGRAIGFNGAPQWATITDAQTFTFRSPWSFNYFEPAVLRAFDHFWDADQGAHPELQQRYLAMWQHVAARFAATPNVLGYDLMNEPFAGSRHGFVVPGPLPVIIGNPAAQAAFEADQLASFYGRTIAAIRAVDADGWIFVEPCMTGANEGSPAHLPRLDDPRAGPPRIVYFPHYYSLLMSVSGTYDTSIDTSIRDWAVNRLADGHRMGAPILIGEWGAGPEFQNYLANLQDTADMADQVTSGWTYWEHGRGGWGIVDANGQETERANVLVRTYPQRVAGEPIAYAYQAKTREFALAWKDVPGVTGPTEIYVPVRRFYPNGFELAVSDPPGTWSSAWDAAREVLSVTTDPATTDHVLRLVPKP
jgi:endoglycosylceramidase